MSRTCGRKLLVSIQTIHAVRGLFDCAVMSDPICVLENCTSVIYNVVLIATLGMLR